MKTMRQKRFLSLTLALLLLLSLVPAAFAAKTATATTLRLEQIEGTATITNKSDKTVSFTSGMKLFNGYGVETGLASYAYISLDATKAVKLDANSEIVLKESGKKLEVDLKKGNLFFDVTVPLAGDEDLSIRTSTMVTGIRGTAGWIEVVSERISILHLLEGVVQAQATNPITGEIRSVEVHAGQRVIFIIHEEEVDLQSGFSEELVEIRIEGYREREVPGFVAAMIRDSQRLQAAITRQTDLDVPLIIGGAAERLREDEVQAAARSAEAQQIAGGLDNDRIDPLFVGGEVAGGSGGSGPSGPPASVTLTGTIPTAQLVATLAGATTVIYDGADTTLNASITIAPGKTLQLTNGSSLILNGQDIFNHSNTTLDIVDHGVFGSGVGGTIINGDDGLLLPGTFNLGDSTELDDLTDLINLLGTVNLGGKVTSTGVGLTVTNNATMNIWGRLETAGEQMEIFNNADMAFSDAYLTSTNGYIYVENNADMVFTGTGGLLESVDPIDIENNGSLDMTGINIITGGDDITFTNTAGSSLNIHSGVLLYSNTGDIVITNQVGGTLTIDPGVVYDTSAQGDIYIVNYGTLVFTAGDHDLSGVTIGNAEGATLTLQSGAQLIGGDLSNEGIIILQSGAVFDGRTVGFVQVASVGSQVDIGAGGTFYLDADTNFPPGVGVTVNIAGTLVSKTSGPSVYDPDVYKLNGGTLWGMFEIKSPFNAADTGTIDAIFALPLGDTSSYADSVALLDALLVVDSHYKFASLYAASPTVSVVMIVGTGSETAAELAEYKGVATEITNLLTYLDDPSGVRYYFALGALDADYASILTYAVEQGLTVRIDEAVTATAAISVDSSEMLRLDFIGATASLTASAGFTVAAGGALVLNGAVFSNQAAFDAWNLANPALITGTIIFAP